MKQIFILILSCFLFSLHTQASTQVEVLSSELGMEDNYQQKTLCLTVIRVPNGSVIGLLEDIEDCYFAREAQGTPFLTLDLKKLKKVANPDLAHHLQRLNTNLKFYFSDGE